MSPLVDAPYYQYLGGTGPTGVRAPSRGPSAPPAAPAGAGREARRQGWDDVDRRLLAWATDPDAAADDDCLAPAPEAIRVAREVAAELRDAGAAAPQRVCPDGEGGIVFERGQGSLFEAVHIRPDLAVDLRTFQDARLVRRDALR